VKFSKNVGVGGLGSFGLGAPGQMHRYGPAGQVHAIDTFILNINKSIPRIVAFILHLTHYELAINVVVFIVGETLR
jgi:hypothetical protein